MDRTKGIEAALHRGARCVQAGLARGEEDARVRRALFFVLLLIIAATMLLLNVHTPLQMDDYDYAFSWSTGELLAGVGDVLASQAAHYRLWGGRSIVHALAQLFLYVGKPVFNVANTLCYLALLLELYALCRSERRRWDWALLGAAHLFLFFGVSFFGTVFLWLDGACNYLWGTAIALWPLLIHRSAAKGGFFSRGGWHGAVSVLLSFVAGWTNENTACGVLALVLLLLAYDGLRGAGVRPWRVAAALSQAAGTAVMLLAPGNFARASTTETGSSMLLTLMRRVATVTAYGCVYTGVLLAALLVLLALARTLRIPTRTGWALSLLAGGLLAAYALVGSPLASDRSFTGPVVLLLGAALTLLADMHAGLRDEQGAPMSAARMAVTPLLLVVLLHGSYTALGDVRTHEATWQAQLERVEAAKAEGLTQVTLSQVISHSRFTMDITLGATASDWPNSTLSRVFGIDVLGE